jgi:Bacterial regulatory helix-turn-helix protein, lysR family
MRPSTSPGEWNLRRNVGDILHVIRFADTGTCTRTAELLDLSPSAVSVKNLERALGARPFGRTTRQQVFRVNGGSFCNLRERQAQLATTRPS